MNGRVLKRLSLIVAGVAALVIYRLLRREGHRKLSTMASDLPGDVTLPPPWADEQR